MTDTDFIHLFENIKNTIIYLATFTRGIFLVYMYIKFGFSERPQKFEKKSLLFWQISGFTK